MFEIKVCSHHMGQNRFWFEIFDDSGRCVESPDRGFVSWDSAYDAAQKWVDAA